MILFFFLLLLLLLLLFVVCCLLFVDCFVVLVLLAVLVLWYNSLNCCKGKQEVLICSWCFVGVYFRLWAWALVATLRREEWKSQLKRFDEKAMIFLIENTCMVEVLLLVRLNALRQPHEQPMQNLQVSPPVECC